MARENYVTFLAGWKSIVQCFSAIKDTFKIITWTGNVILEIVAILIATRSYVFRTNKGFCEVVLALE